MIEPLNDFLLVEQIVEEKGEIVTTVDDVKIPDRGIVKSVGEHCKYVKVGDEVLFIKYATYEFKIDGDDVVLVRESDVIAKNA